MVRRVRLCPVLVARARGGEPEDGFSWLEDGLQAAVCETSLSSQQGQVTKGPGNHIKTPGLYPGGSVEGLSSERAWRRGFTVPQHPAERLHTSHHCGPHSNPEKDVL